MKTPTKHPDFNEWILTKEGLECADMTNLSDEKFLKNRLFWAFDAGRNCVWDQCQSLKKANGKLIKAARGVCQEFDDPIDSANAFQKLNDAIADASKI